MWAAREKTAADCRNSEKSSRTLLDELLSPLSTKPVVLKLSEKDRHRSFPFLLKSLLHHMISPNHRRRSSRGNMARPATTFSLLDWSCPKMSWVMGWGLGAVHPNTLFTGGPHLSACKGSCKMTRLTRGSPKQRVNAARTKTNMCLGICSIYFTKRKASPRDLKRAHHLACSECCPRSFGFPYGFHWVAEQFAQHFCMCQNAGPPKSWPSFLKKKKKNTHKPTHPRTPPPIDPPALLLHPGGGQFQLEPRPGPSEPRFLGDALLLRACLS